MKVISISRWGDGGVQLNYEMTKPEEGLGITHTEMALPSNKTEFDRLMAVRLYTEFDITGVKTVI